MKNNKMKFRILTGIIAIILILLGICVYHEKSSICETVLALTTPISVLLILYQLHSTKVLAKGEFVLNLNNSFNSNTDMLYVFQKAWEAEDEFTKKDEKKLLQYFTFFETLYILTETNAIDIEMLDELFARRFFAVINNKSVQKVDLVAHNKYYKNIYALDKKWRDYRKNMGKPIDFGNKDCIIGNRQLKYKYLCDADKDYDSMIVKESK